MNSFFTDLLVTIFIFTPFIILLLEMEKEGK